MPRNAPKKQVERNFCLSKFLLDAQCKLRGARHEQGLAGNLKGLGHELLGKGNNNTRNMVTKTLLLPDMHLRTIVNPSINLNASVAFVHVVDDVVQDASGNGY